MPRLRLDRAISRLGLASRSEARTLIASGRVTVGGRLETDPGRLVPPDASRIAIEGRAAEPVAWRTIALHKPRGVVTTSRDPQGRPTIYDRLGPAESALVAAGRLDMASTGLLLLTTDTNLAAWLTDPANGIVRRYVVTARGRVSDEAVRQMVEGRGGLRAHRVEVRKRSGRETHLIVELTEGKNREIRRLLAGVGHEVTRLLRISFGGIELERLQPGEWREVGRDEIAAAFPDSPAAAAARPRVAETGRYERESSSPAMSRHSSSSGPVAGRRPARRYQ